MGMLFQSGALFTDLSVFENVAFPLRIHTDLPDDMIRDLVLIKLQSVGLRGAAELEPSELSGGMVRRVALARAIALDPGIMMYDEPFAGLDPIAMGVIMDLIKTLNRVYGMTSIVVSHDIHETASIADFIYIISDGKVIGAGAPDDLFNESSPRVEQFVKGLPDGPVPFHYPARDYKDELLDSSNSKSRI
jgi:phospholipid/cholesterol/gamma-HCH transport system ATP-binding protein